MTNYKLCYYFAFISSPCFTAGQADPAGRRGPGGLGGGAGGGQRGERGGGPPRPTSHPAALRPGGDARGNEAATSEGTGENGDTHERTHARTRTHAREAVTVC